ncbi:MAG: TPM domain-containing protein, partial [Geitlerinemataceae cyanobacterium]
MMKPLFHTLLQYKRSAKQAFLSVLLATIASIMLATPVWATGVYDLPIVSAGDSDWVIDDANVLSLVGKGNIKNNLTRINEQTGTEVRFVTVRKLDYGETIESFTNSLFEAWYSTPEVQAKQVLLVLDTLTNNSA